MAFGSWTHTLDEINLTMVDPNVGIDRGVYHTDSKESTEWNITNIFPYRQVENNTVVLQYQIHLQVITTFITQIQYPEKYPVLKAFPLWHKFKT